MEQTLLSFRLEVWNLQPRFFAFRAEEQQPHQHAGAGDAHQSGVDFAIQTHAECTLQNYIQRIAQEKESEQPVIGLIYFPMEKQKVKDLELIITTASGKLSMRFK